MSKDLALTLPDSRVAAEEPRSIMQVIAQAVMSGTTSVEVMRELLAMQVQVEQRAAEVEFNAALARLMPKLPRIEKDGIIRDRSGSVRSRYARYEDIDLIIRPLLAEEGFSMSFDTEEATAGFIRITGTLAHRMGHNRKSQLTIPTASQVITGAQAIGSAVSFGKRYVVINMLNIVTVGVDNDGQGDPDPIGAEQVLTIDTLLKDTKSDVKKFLEWMGVAKIEDILAKDYQKAVKGLEAKRRQ